MRWLFLLYLISLLGVVRSLSTAGTRLLIIVEEAADREKYSKLWQDLEGRDFNLTFESPKNEKLSLFHHGARAYDHLILLPPKSKGFGPKLTPKLLLNFYNAEGNILLTLSADSATPTGISTLLLELDIHLPLDRTSLVADHFNYDVLSASEKHDVLVLPRPTELRSDVRNYFSGLPGDVLAFPRGVGHTLGAASPLLAPILRAQRTAYVYNPNEDTETVEDPFETGVQIALVSAMQARNSARFTVLGSAEMLEDKWFDAKVQRSAGVAGGKDSKATTTANRAFAKELTAWTFKEIGVVRVGRIEHYPSAQPGSRGGNDSTLDSDSPNQKIYRVKSDVTYAITLSEYSYTHLIPFTLPETDSLQLEFSMLSPFYRLTLQHSVTTANASTFTTAFTLPDQHGIFNFLVNYKRPFVTNVEEKRTVTVRHFAHDEWPRSWEISGGWVWIAGIWTTVAGWLAFVAIWLWSEPVKSVGAKKAQ
ncbi:MAG: oligosaccharyl transferase glycoprotein complex, beta subunit [Trizodia sp. TS-e1964]|nr:MAG: oligosaccharyl transferase glycoprotein complex, beta subunit [Trizodia sp. TS-e1964]